MISNKTKATAFEYKYLYLNPPFGCQISARNGLFLVIKGPKFQTKLGGFR